MDSCNSSEAFGCVDTGLHAFALWYWGVHSYLSIIICLVGIVTNILNIIILGSKEMRTPVNTILTGIAVADILTMTSYIPYAIHYYIETPLGLSPERYSHGWTAFMAVHAMLTMYTHTATIWLGVFLAVLRYLIVTCGRKFTIFNTCKFIGLVYFVSGMSLIPNILITKLLPVPYGNDTIWKLEGIGIGEDNQTVLMNIAFWVYAVLGKILPCTLITVFGALLLLTLKESKKRTLALKGSSSDNRMKQHNRTTIMLLVIIIMFIMTEVPQGIAIIMAGTVKNFMRNVYLLLADIFDVVALINNSINFWLYCTMNHQFRQHLVKLFPKISMGRPGYRRASTANTHVENGHTQHTAV